MPETARRVSPTDTARAAATIDTAGPSAVLGIRANASSSGSSCLGRTIETIDSGSRMTIESVFPTVEALEQMLAMGMEEGLKEAVGQIDAILAEDTVTTR